MSYISALTLPTPPLLIYLDKIEKKREQLFRTAEIYGMYASETLKCSRELDQLIVSVQEQHMTLQS